ncbi:hypothetical protein CYMTET_7242 [Cymbomonas tetramitiformis]|uniref:WRC domain-containing protein n=1 Tax=Cymbomonas tetramitiformis TaxID=36881 RepID=A0AAE0GW27_9CHLO|nr:hypothetical protein CYMTET_7242 [Cymbomonas tetramitiformis]
MEDAQGNDMELDADEALARALQREELHLRPRPRRAPPGDLAYMQALEAPQLATSSSTNAGVIPSAAARNGQDADQPSSCPDQSDNPSKGVNPDVDGARVSPAVTPRASSSAMLAAKRLCTVTHKTQSAEAGTTTSTIPPASPSKALPPLENGEAPKRSAHQPSPRSNASSSSVRQGGGGGRADGEEERASSKRKEPSGSAHEAAGNSESHSIDTWRGKKSKLSDPSPSAEKTEASEGGSWEMLKLLAAESINAATTASQSAARSQDASAAAAAGHPTPVSKTDEADPAAEGRPSRSAAELKDAAAAGGKESCGEQAKHSATSKEQAQKKRSARSEPKRQEEAVPVPPKTGNLQAWRQALSTRELQVLYKDMFGVATKVHNKDWILSKISEGRGQKGLPPLASASGKASSSPRNPTSAPAAVPAAKPVPAPAESVDTAWTRCSRNDGKNWRCSEKAVQGHKHCQKHLRWVNGSAVGDKYSSMSEVEDLSSAQAQQGPQSPALQTGSSKDKANGHVARAAQSIKLPPNGSSRGAEIKPKAENDLPSPYKFKSLKSKWLSAYQEECREAATDGLSPSSSAHGQVATESKPVTEEADGRWEALVAASAADPEGAAGGSLHNGSVKGDDRETEVKLTKSTRKKQTGVQLEGSNDEMRVANSLRQIPAS